MKFEVLANMDEVSEHSVIWTSQQDSLQHVFRLLQADPQLPHKLSRVNQCNFVNNLCITFLLLVCNDKKMDILGRLDGSFLPTMKFQLSQLP